MSHLVPGINVFDVDRNILNKMFPLSYFTEDFDELRTCCSKLNTSYLNLKYIKFNRTILYTLDMWLLKIFEIVFFKQNINYSLPTPHFFQQSLTDCFLILLYVVDDFLYDNTIKICFRKSFFCKYGHHFDDFQKYLLITILKKISKKIEFEELDILKNISNKTSKDVKLFLKLFEENLENEN